MSTRPRRLLVGLAVALGTVVPAAPALAEPVIRTPDDASYVIELTAGGSGRTWTGTWSATFRNTGTAPLSEIWIRLWANGLGGCTDPGITVSNVTGGTAGDLEVSCSALPVALGDPLEPGSVTTIGMDIEIRPPKINDRFGWFDDSARMGNAVPILGVHDDEGWHLDPYVAFGESFYSLASDWEVTLIAPGDLDTPATGVEVASVAVQGGLEARTYVAKGVRDFAWSAGHFRQEWDTDANGVRIRLWYERGSLSRDRLERLLHDSVRSMDTFSASFGAYPYDEVDIVVAGFVTFAGMEYPQLIFSIPDRVTISHELAHQWWYGIVGDDEFEDPWVDEGFATWSMFLPFEHAGWPPLPWVGCPMFNWPNDRVHTSSTMGYFLRHPNDYWVAYWQGGCALAHLAKDFGLDRFLEVLRSYAADHWLGLATTADFQAAIEAAAAEDGLDLDPQKFWTRWRIGNDP